MKTKPNGETMDKTKYKYQKVLIVILAFILSFPGLIHSAKQYKIVSYKGKVKVMKRYKIKLPDNINKKINWVRKPNIILRKDDAVMAYRGASVKMSFPSGDIKTFKGPFYATAQTLEKGIDKEQLTAFETPALWKRIERVFDEEGDSTVITRSGPNDKDAFYKEIKKRAVDSSLQDNTLPPHKKSEMETALKIAETAFNAFPKVKQTIVRALVYKQYGMNKTALSTVFSHYESIRGDKAKEKEQDAAENYMYNEFLPIVVHIVSKGNHRQLGFFKLFSSNFKLWWAVFYYDGNQLIEIEKTIDYKQEPQKLYRLRKPIKKKTGAVSQCVFIVVCPDWSQLETLDDIESAKKELLTGKVKETQVTTIRDWGKVTIKLCIGNYR